jgi:hypothetical protein
MLLLLSNLTPAFFFPPKSDETEKQKSLRHSKLRANPSFSFEFLIFLETQGGAAGRTARRVQHKPHNSRASLLDQSSVVSYHDITIDIAIIIAISRANSSLDYRLVLDSKRPPAAGRAM